MQRKESTVDEIVRLFDLKPETENQVRDRSTAGINFSDLSRELARILNIAFLEKYVNWEKFNKNAKRIAFWLVTGRLETSYKQVCQVWGSKHQLLTTLDSFFDLYYSLMLERSLCLVTRNLFM